MFFISAQPDELYFLWQLKLQLFNFNSLHIDAGNVHVLIGYNPSKGLNPLFKQFIETNREARFFVYPDTRESKTYASSIRPHIIAKHFENNPDLQEAAIFYHDADVIFRECPAWEPLLQDDTWYASDTRSYLSGSYILSTAGEDVMDKMCAVVGILPEVVKENDRNAGGAQYLLKGVSVDFWKKIERDCERMFSTIKPLTARKGVYDKKENKGTFDPWCTDMWVIWWNALLSGKDFKIHPALDFCWATSPVEEWERCTMLHYTGGVDRGDKRYFRKSDYSFYPPFFCDFSGIQPDSCSAPLVRLIEAYKKELLAERIDLSDVTFLIPVRIDSKERVNNLNIVIQYLSVYFNTHIIVLEADARQNVDPDLLPETVEYHFLEDGGLKFRKTRCINQLVKLAGTPYISIYDTDVVAPIGQIIQSVELLRGGKCSAVSPYDGAFASVDIMAKFLFSKIMDPEYLEINRGKTGIGVKRSWGGALFLNRKDFIKAGMSNENFTSWGPEDLEHPKRMEILGYGVKRVKGTLYHLKHPRGENSGYQTEEEHATLMNEYLKICSLEKSELETYVSTWEWCK